jgi:hypothetical protein
MKKSELVQIIKEELQKQYTTLGDLKLGVNVKIGDSLPLPHSSDEMYRIYAQKALDNYLKAFDLNTKIIIDRTKPWSEQFTVPAWKKDQERAYQAKQNFLDKERSSGRTSGLD